ncbi:hypothetical protein FACS1894172_11760 [Spirochaetia bacterium]|nr:hypothetical protein FACS1894164_20260 [Spirochaetia bacterium]GHU33379.1 hypothetical protein FACS1894172_11760 [Spirochaetia bacterium]
MRNITSISQRTSYFKGYTIEYDLSKTIIKIIELYINAKRDAFESFIRTCEELQNIGTQD